MKRLTSAFLDAVDGASPGLVEALYLTGSVALGDFREARSDVDFVAIVNGADEGAVSALAIALRGPGLEERAVWYRPATLASWTRTNLVEYWEPWLRRYAAGSAELDHDEDSMVWGVLGISRLHYTLATGRITSKTGAGEYARAAFGQQWHPLLVEASRARCAPGSSSGYDSATERRREVIAYVTMVLREACSPAR